MHKNDAHRVKTDSVGTYKNRDALRHPDASLLPKFRGAAPLNWSIIKGEKVTGNTTMLMDVGLDTGDMLLKDEVEITDNMTAGELHDILMERGGELLVRTIIMK